MSYVGTAALVDNVLNPFFDSQTPEPTKAYKATLRAIFRSLAENRMALHILAAINAGTAPVGIEKELQAILQRLSTSTNEHSLSSQISSLQLINVEQKHHFETFLDVIGQQVHLDLVNSLQKMK